MKVRFIELHRELFDKIPEIWFYEYKSETGKEIIEAARKRIGYSPKYVDMDLFRSLMNSYLEIYNKTK